MVVKATQHKKEAYWLVSNITQYTKNRKKVEAIETHTTFQMRNSFGNSPPTNDFTSNKQKVTKEWYKLKCIFLFGEVLNLIINILTQVIKGSWSSMKNVL